MGKHNPRFVYPTAAKCSGSCCNHRSSVGVGPATAHAFAKRGAWCQNRTSCRRTERLEVTAGEVEALGGTALAILLNQGISWYLIRITGGPITEMT